MPAATRTILHVDMDAFYASIEQRDDPRLRGRPVVVGGDNRGVVAAASYEVRKFGVRSAMPMSEARRRCPGLLRVAPRMAHYQAVSEEIFAVFREVTPLVEGLSLDEAFLDVTGSLALLGPGEQIARRIKARILEQTSLTASVGVAANKLVAKIASDLDKPDGLVVVTPANARQVLDPLPVSVIPGVGARTLGLLHDRGILTVADLRLAPVRDLERVFGRHAQRMRDKAAGIDTRPVKPSREEKSISSESTYDVDLDDRAAMERELLRLTETTARRLRKAGLQAGTVQVKIRRADFATFTRQQKLGTPASSTDQVYATARNLLGAWLGDNPGSRVRLLGVGCSGLSAAVQQDLFAPAAAAAANAVDATVDSIRDRFGAPALTRARTLKRP
jgi:DNA polymerase-4